MKKATESAFPWPCEYSIYVSLFLNKVNRIPLSHGGYKPCYINDALNFNGEEVLIEHG